LSPNHLLRVRTSGPRAVGRRPLRVFCRHFALPFSDPCAVWPFPVSELRSTNEHSDRLIRIVFDLAGLG
jgi:hypothetical protein